MAGRRLIDVKQWWVATAMLRAQLLLLERMQRALQRCKYLHHHETRNCFPEASRPTMYDDVITGRRIPSIETDRQTERLTDSSGEDGTHRGHWRSTEVLTRWEWDGRSVWTGQSLTAASADLTSNISALSLAGRDQRMLQHSVCL